MFSDFQIFIEVDGNRTELKASFGADICRVEGSGAPAKVIVVAPSMPYIRYEVAPGFYRDSAGCDGAGVWLNTLAPGKHVLNVNFPSANPSVSFPIEYAKVAPPTPAHLAGFISDNGDPQANVTKASEFGIGEAVRLWCQWDNVTGKLNDTGIIARVKAYRATGAAVVVCFSPPEWQTSYVYPSKAIATIVNSDMPRDGVTLEGPNEPNMPNGRYWRNGNWREACEWWDRMAGDFKAGGFECGSCAFTWSNTSDLELWWNEITTNRWDKNLAWVFGHVYTTIREWVPSGTNISKAVVDTYKRIARARGKNVGITEYGFYEDKDLKWSRATRDAKFAEAYGILAPYMVANTDAAFYYILRELPNNTEFGLYLVDAAGNHTAIGLKAIAVKNQAQS